MKTYLFCLLVFSFPVFADYFIDSDELMEISHENHHPLFVSLGANCMPARILKSAGLRSAAYPFDWIFSLENQGLILAIEEGCSSLLEDEYLIPDNYLIPNSSGASLIHNKYCFEFVHEGDFRGLEYEGNMARLREKYNRRVKRFNHLNSHKGPVIFIRRSFELSLLDPHRTFKPKEVIHITDKDAMALYGTLKKKFPDLDLKLVVMNSGYTDRIIVEKFLNQDVIKISCVVKVAEGPLDVGDKELVDFFAELPKIFERGYFDNGAEFEANEGAGIAS